MKHIIFDMETGDPDDMVTLLMLLKNNDVNLKAVTCYEGSAEQIGLIKHVIAMSGKSIPVAGWNSENKGLSPYYGEVVGSWKPQAAEMTPVELLLTTLNEDTTLLTGAPLTNISKYLQAYPCNTITRTITQGGYLGNIIPEERVLDKFKGRKAIRTYNLTQDTDAFTVVNSSPQIQDLTYITKDLCHGFLYTKEIHDQINFKNDSISALLFKALNYYVQKGVPKAMHDPLAMLYMLDPTIGSRSPISMNCHLDKKHKVFSSTLANDSSSRFGLVAYNNQMAWSHFISICSG